MFQRSGRLARVGPGVVERCCTGPLQATAGREDAIALDDTNSARTAAPDQLQRA